ncbi:DUF4397 domain-containing protein [Pedobacter sp.]|uniref:DUF4397 domain-containing protein n=1 Tax=Pedobacter sp. TaxID=1411316 RepID=UPI003D7F2D6B
MKTPLSLNQFRKKATLLVALLGTAIFFNACKNDIDNTTPAIAALSVVNAFPNANTLNFYIGNAQVNNTGIAFGEKLSYLNAYEGSRVFDVAFTGSSTSLLSKAQTLKGGMYHTVYIVGKTTADLEYLLVTDSLTVPKEGEVNLRFMNLSPDAPALSLERASDTTKFDNKAFKAYTKFKPLTAAKSNFILRNKETNAVLATLDDVELVKGRIYTVWAKGLVAGTDATTKLAIKVSEH